MKKDKVSGFLDLSVFEGIAFDWSLEAVPDSIVELE